MSTVTKTDTNSCPNCGKPKKYWFPLCYECQEKDSQKPKCEICRKPTPLGHTLCTEHWKEKQEQKQNLKSIDFIKSKKEIEYREKFEGKYYFDAIPVKSKSELLICYFLSTNGISFRYEPAMILNEKEIRPDFVIEDQLGNTIILEHFGRDDKEYNKKRADKERDFNELCKQQPRFYFVFTDEETINNLKDRLGKKLNETPLRKNLWK